MATDHKCRDENFHNWYIRCFAHRPHCRLAGSTAQFCAGLIKTAGLSAQSSAIGVHEIQGQDPNYRLLNFFVDNAGKFPH